MTPGPSACGWPSSIHPAKNVSPKTNQEQTQGYTDLSTAGHPKLNSIIIMLSYRNTFLEFGKLRNEIRQLIGQNCNQSSKQNSLGDS
ncbi:hypothetical protein SKAU_G00314440 [Synaphobranchus kaupii]|uniref:Uncharacterized protein n=1 Tax=Synaphobranchus kaupii TaxID=118154 RepID=A0A9Q1ESA8_SYNKA|nr:hypothetical protein SKAU_G00314440 [Synaphobranchus kaupii]